MEKIGSNSQSPIKLCRKTQFQVQLERLFKQQKIKLKSQSVYYIENPPYSDFVIEKLDANTLSFAHYSVQNSDLISDPEITFKICKDIWVPAELNVGICKNIFSNPKNKSEILLFVDMWIKNLIEQKFLEKKLYEYNES